MTRRLEGKVAIITGGSRGQGEAEARLFVKEGAKVVIADVLDAEGQAVADDIGADCRFVHLDVTDEEQWQAVVEATVEAFGPPTVLVNNAGILAFNSTLHMDAAEFRRVIDINLTGRFLGIKEGHVSAVPRDNSRSYASPGWRTTVFGPAVRAGAWAGQFVRPELWRAASVPLISQLQAGGAHRPKLAPDARARLLPHFEEDIDLLSELTGQPFRLWRSVDSRGSFQERATT